MDNLSNYTVYAHKNKVDGKVYVGITSQELKKRWKSGYGYSEKSHIGRAIRLYGWSNFEHVVIASNVTCAVAKEIEKSLVCFLDLTNPNKGYNEAMGGGGGGMLGKHQSEESKQKIRIARKQGGFTEEHKKHISEAKSGTNHHLAKPVYQYAKDGTFLGAWPYMNMAAESLKIQKTSISACCLGKRPSAGGFIWTYEKK